MTSTFELRIIETNEQKLKASMVIDGTQFGEDAIDLSELKKSAIISGAYDIQTCGCGEPACAGFWEPIFVQHEGNLIRWEFDDRYHPVPKKADDDDSKLIVVRYEFDRMQYIKEVQSKFDWLRNHPSRGSLGPHGFNPAILDEDFPDPLSPQLPYPAGSTIIVGYTKDFHQPWVWVEGCSEIYPRQLLPTGAMWSMFGCWSLMWDSDLFNIGQCLYRKDETAFSLRSEVSSAECNLQVERLVEEILKYWNGAARVEWYKIDNADRTGSHRITAT